MVQLRWSLLTPLGGPCHLPHLLGSRRHQWTTQRRGLLLQHLVPMVPERPLGLTAYPSLQTRLPNLATRPALSHPHRRPQSVLPHFRRVMVLLQRTRLHHLFLSLRLLLQLPPFLIWPLRWPVAFHLFGLFARWLPLCTFLIPVDLFIDHTRDHVSTYQEVATYLYILLVFTLHETAFN